MLKYRLGQNVSQTKTESIVLFGFQLIEVKKKKLKQSKKVIFILLLQLLTKIYQKEG